MSVVLLESMEDLPPISAEFYQFAEEFSHINFTKSELAGSSGIVEDSGAPTLGGTSWLAVGVMGLAGMFAL